MSLTKINRILLLSISLSLAACGGNSGAKNIIDNCPVTSNQNQTHVDKNGIDEVCDTDSDQDSVIDGLDNCPLIENNDQLDTDSDGKGDVCDMDDDGDSILDSVDNCPLTSNISQDDQDFDDQGDSCDADRDGDGVLNTHDNCPVNENVDQADADKNGVGDVCDTDSDQDGVVDGLDNCPETANPDQLDTDSDSQGNACDTDDDNDGLSDLDEATRGTNPLNSDTDNDDVTDNNDAFPLDAQESRDQDGDSIGDNADNCPLISNAAQENQDGDAQGDACDTDRDGDDLSNEDEIALGTNPDAVDSDQDDINDNLDNCPITSNPNQTNTDADTQGDACDTDDDNDGILDSNDTFPLDPSETQDTDGDGVGDNSDNCPTVKNEDQADNYGDERGDACEAIPGDAVMLPIAWYAYGDSQTSGRASEANAQSPMLVFERIWKDSGYAMPSSRFNGVSGATLGDALSRYNNNAPHSKPAWVHFQDSGSQKSTTATQEQFGDTLDNFVNTMFAEFENSDSVISTETAFSFGREDEAGRNWDGYNNELRDRLADQAAAGKAVYIAEVDQHIKALQSELSPGDVWFQNGESNAYHYKGLGNLMVALAMFEAFGYDVDTLNLTGISEEGTITSERKQLCLDIIKGRI